MNEYEFESESIEVFGIQVLVSGKLEFDIEDTAIGSVPYGDTHVWHPGGGMQAIDVCVTELKSFQIEDQYEGKGKDRKLKTYASEVEAVTFLVAPEKLWSAVGDAIDLDDEVRRVMDSLKEDAELATHGL